LFVGGAVGLVVHFPQNAPRLVAAVEPAGFKLVRIVELSPYHYGAIFEKP
jgi:hypothetical protein